MKLKIAIALLSASLLGIGSCRKAPTNTSTSGLATIVCDDSFENIMNQEMSTPPKAMPTSSPITFPKKRA